MIIARPKKKVCILTTVHESFDIRIFHKQAKTLVDAGYVVTLIAQHARDEVVDGVKIKALPKPKNRIGRIFRCTLTAFFYALCQKGDVYHIHDPELLPVGFLLKIFTGAKVIYDVHEDVPKQILTKYWIPKSFRPLLSLGFNGFEKLIARAMDAVVVATEGIAKRFLGLNPIVVHNYPNLEMLPYSYRMPGQQKEKVLIYSGGISFLRGAFEMIKALELLNATWKVRLDLIGRFEPRELEKKLQALKGFRCVRFLGFLKPEDVYNYLRSSDIGLACLHPEPRFMVGLPIKLFEYMAAGLPVIVSNFPLCHQIVEGNSCGLCVDPLKPQEIARAIEYLLAHPAEAYRMGQNGRRAVEEKYNWKNEAKKLIELYESIFMRS